MLGAIYWEESFTDEETALLGRYFSNLDRPVCALVNLPEVVKGALFARYSRSPKSIRRLFLDEFVKNPELGINALASQLPDGTDDRLNTRRATDLYEKIFTDYGDDSVAQLGGVHLACEQASNILTKVLEWGRLAAYLEQSTRYIYYDIKLGSRYRYYIPPEVAEGPHLSDYTRTLDGLFDTYRDLIPKLSAYYEELYPRAASDPLAVWKSTIRARVCDDLRGLLPAATLSNVGVFADGQAIEALLLRMRAHPLAEVRSYSDLILDEAKKVVPSFVRRVELPDRGGRWSTYLKNIAEAMGRLGGDLKEAPEARPEVILTEWDQEAEMKIAAAALYSVTALPDDQLLALVRRMPDQDRLALVKAYVGDRGNRRHKPGRALERSFYRFDILGDYGLFRDLQRHRMLTVEWQRLSPRHGYDVPRAVVENGLEALWHNAMERAATLFDRIASSHGDEVAQYVVPLAFKIRFYFHLNAREAFHLLELRTSPAGHPNYRRVCQEMHRLIREQAGHKALADAMIFVDHDIHELGRLDAERRTAAKGTTLA